jgi:hypothetical protein
MVGNPIDAPRRTDWVLLAYRLPREPSTPRITLWRRLRGLGVAQVMPGLVALPLDARNREQLEWLADRVVEAGGWSSIWLGTLANRNQERALIARMVEAVASDYRDLIARAAAVIPATPAGRRLALRHLRAELRAIRARDYFPGSIGAEAQAAVDRTAATIEAAS